MTTKTSFDYIVIGCGGIGSATAYWLARRAGSEVLGLEQFELGHHHGGSQDYSRIIRLSYHHLDYTRLTPHTYGAWAVLEAESAVQVVHKTGGLEMAPAGTPYEADLNGYAAAMDAAGIPYERLEADEIMRRYPQFTIRERVAGLFQAETGLADGIKGNAAHIGMARGYGATILDHCRVDAIHPVGGAVEVDTPQGKFSARRLIITAGAWADALLAQLGLSLRLTVTQEQVTYYATPNLHDFAMDRFPVFIWHGPRAIYGFPIYGEVATKVGIDAAGPAVTADTRTYDPDPERERVAEAWLREHIPGFLGPKLYTKTCLYDMPPDRNFVIDSLPDHPQIFVCCGAGHAYKFAALLGRILSELAIDSRTGYPIGPFALRRPAITDPLYVSDFHI